MIVFGVGNGALSNKKLYGLNPKDGKLQTLKHSIVIIIKMNVAQRIKYGN